MVYVDASRVYAFPYPSLRRPRRYSSKPIPRNGSRNLRLSLREPRGWERSRMRLTELTRRTTCGAAPRAAALCRGTPLVMLNQTPQPSTRGVSLNSFALSSLKRRKYAHGTFLPVTSRGFVMWSEIDPSYFASGNASIQQDLLACPRRS